MTLGEKIKSERKKKKMTQEQIAGEKITRNMLSAIECNKASPSIESLIHIASKLDVPIAYFLSDDDNLFYFKKQSSIAKIRDEYSKEKYDSVIHLIEEIGETDDELAFLLACSAFELGRKRMLVGALISARKYLELAKKYCDKTVYDTSRLKMLLPLYTALTENIQSPMLEFDSSDYKRLLIDKMDFELYKYVIADYDYEHSSPLFAKHRSAKELIKGRQYQEALRLLNEIVEEKNPETYNAHLMFLVYSDLEFCYKQILDFENAYKFASKKLSMIEGFKA